MKPSTETNTIMKKQCSIPRSRKNEPEDENLETYKSGEYAQGVGDEFVVWILALETLASSFKGQKTLKSDYKEARVDLWTWGSDGG